MLEVEIDEAIRGDDKLLSAVEHATTLLSEEIKPRAGSVLAEWRLFAADQRIPTVRLKITHETDSAMTHFQRAKLPELTDSALRLIFVRLWGDLLQERSHAQMKELRHLVERM